MGGEDTCPEPVHEDRGRFSEKEGRVSFISKEYLRTTTSALVHRNSLPVFVFCRVLAGIFARSLVPGAIISGSYLNKRVETTESSQETKNEFQIITYIPGARAGSDASLFSRMRFQLWQQSGVWRGQPSGERESVGE
jgi:hypothetical protein